MARDYNDDDDIIQSEEEKDASSAYADDFSDDEKEELPVEPDSNYDGDDENAPPERKKKRHCCLTCFITLLIIVALLTAGLLGGSYFAWDYFIGKESGVNVFQAIGLFSKALKADDSKVTERYSDSDLNGFYNGLLEALCMEVSDNYEWNVSDIIFSYIQGDSEAAQVLAANTDSSSSDVTDTTGNAELDKLLNALNFDWDTLKDGANRGMLQLNGKQLAAFLNDVVTKALADKSIMGKLGVDADLSGCATIEQIKIMSGITINDASTAIVATIKITPKDILDRVRQQYLASLPAFAVNIAKSILPAQMYLTAQIRPLNENGSAMLYFNGLDDAQMNKMFSVVDAVLKLAGSDIKIREQLLHEVNVSVCNALNKVQELVPVNFLGDGIFAYPVDLLLDKMNVELSAAQFFDMVRYFASPNHYYTPEMLKEFDYVDYTKDAEIMLDTIKRNYGLAGADEIKPDNLYTSLKRMFDGESALIDKIDVDNVINDTSINYDTYVPLSYGGFAGLVRGYLQESNFSDNGIVFNLCSFEYDSVASEKYGSIFAKLRIDVDVKQTLANMGFDLSSYAVLENLLSQIIPDKSFISATVDIGAILTGGNMKVIFEFNDCGDDTEEFLDSVITLISGLEVNNENLSNLSYKGLQDTIANAISGISESGSADMIVKMDEEYIYIDNVYSLLYNYGYVKAAQDGNIEPLNIERFSKAIQSLYRFDAVASDNGGSAYSTKTYMGADYSPSPDESNWSIDISDADKSMSISDRLLGNILVDRERRVASDDSGDSKLSDELGLQGEVEYGKTYWLEQVSIVTPQSLSSQAMMSYYADAFKSYKSDYNANTDSYMVVTVAVSINAFVGGKSLAGLLPRNIYVTAFMEIGDDEKYHLPDGTINPNAHQLFIVINNINASVMGDLFSIVEVIDKDVSDNFLSEQKINDLQNNLHRFMMEFAVYESSDGSLMPDISVGEIVDIAEAEAVEDGGEGLGKMTFAVRDLISLVMPGLPDIPVIPDIPQIPLSAALREDTLLAA